RDRPGRPRPGLVRGGPPPARRARAGSPGRLGPGHRGSRVRDSPGGVREVPLRDLQGRRSVRRGPLGGCREQGRTPMTNPSPVLVTDAPSNANLAVVRSLGRRGIPVGVCGFEGEFNLSFHSRYVQERLHLPSPALDPAGFLESLQALLVTGKYPILFPTTERTIQLVAAHRERFPPWMRIPIAPREAIETVLDKEATLALAQRLGVPTPRTWCPEGPTALAGVLAEARYPVIVKPRQTNFLGEDGHLHKTGYTIVPDAAGLARRYDPDSPP